MVFGSDFIKRRTLERVRRLFLFFLLWGVVSFSINDRGYKLTNDSMMFYWADPMFIEEHVFSDFKSAVTGVVLSVLQNEVKAYRFVSESEPILEMRSQDGTLQEKPDVLPMEKAGNNGDSLLFELIRKYLILETRSQGGTWISFTFAPHWVEEHHGGLLQEKSDVLPTEKTDSTSGSFLFGLIRKYLIPIRKVLKHFLI